MKSNNSVMDAMQSLIMMELTKNLSANTSNMDTSPMKGRERINSSFGEE